MRLSTAAIYTLGLLSASELSQSAIAAPSNPVQNPPQDVVVETETESKPLTAVVATPETVKTQEFSRPKSAIPALQSTSSVPTSKSIATPARSTLAQVPPRSTPKSTPTPTKPAPTPADVTLTATDVQISGVDAELQQIIQSKIRTQPGGNVNNRQLQADIATILGTELFRTATVNTRTNPNGLSVIFQVQPTTVRSLRLVNAQALTPDLANTFFKSQLGAAVSPSSINQSIRQVNDWYRQNGYTLARVVTATPNRDGTLNLEVAEGTIGDVQIRFTDEQGKTIDDKGQPIRGRTQESFVRQQLQVKPGQVFQEKAVREDLQRLFQTGQFTNGQISLEGDARRTIVVYNLAEARSRAVDLSGGYSDDLGLYGNFGYSDRNFNGVGQQLSSNVLVGLKDFQFNGRFVNPYRDSEPDKLGYSISGFRQRGTSRVFDDEVKLANDDRVREGRFGGAVSVNRPIGDSWNGSLGVNYNRVSLRDGSGNVVQRDAKGNPLSFSGTGIDDLTTVNFTATRDGRDNPVDPTRGSVLSFSTEQSVPIGRGNILSNRLQANYSQYVPVNFFNLGKAQQQSEVLAVNVQAGTTIGDLPPYNAFTMGGPNSVRGYGTGEVGIGRSYMLASAEYRFPIYSIVGGAVFADFASDLGSGKAVLGEPGVQRGRPGSGFGVGLGLRVKSPFGIIRAGYGINDQGEGRFQVGFGEKF
jgi:outer membrane protein insertion porin family